MKNKTCITKFCRKTANAGRYCYSCAKRRYAKKNPVKYAYQVLRNNAKRRNKVFTLTFDEFKEFCYKYDYLAGRGKKKESYSIDRIDNTKGYTRDNIQVLTLSENSRKATKTLNAYYCEYEGKVIASVNTHIPDNSPIDWDSIINEVSQTIDTGLKHSENCSCCNILDKSVPEFHTLDDEEVPF